MIKIIKEPDLEVTQAEYDYFESKWLEIKEANKPTLEQFIRDRIQRHRGSLFMARAQQNAYSS